MRGWRWIALSMSVMLWTVLGSAWAVGAPAYSAFLGISKENAAILNRGEPIIRTVRDAEALSLASLDDRTKALRQRVAKLKPNYLTELLLSIPLGKERTASVLLDRLSAALGDVSGYVKIPYWSVRQQTFYDLFDKMEILDRVLLDHGESIEVKQHMEPFDDFRARYEYRKESGSLAFSGVNLDPIVYSYRNLSAVAPGGMLWEMYAFVKEGRLNVYGVGAVKAFDLFGLFRDRLEPSFMGRVEAFFRHISSKINK